MSDSSHRHFRHFLGSEFTPAPRRDAHFHIFPVPFEATVSYGGGTAAGPAAVLDTSQQLEIYVEGIGIPGDRGIYTAGPLDIGKERTEDLFKIIQDLFNTSLDQKSFPIFIGGEHSISNGVIQALAELSQPFTNSGSTFGRQGTGQQYSDHAVGILQFDAHCDLRDSYEGSRWSHASVMLRAVERGIPLFQVGVRNYAPEELLIRRKYRIPHLDASEIHTQIRNGMDLSKLRLPDSFPEKIFISFDLDAFDASLMPATGTPEPGGLFWHDTLSLLSGLTQGRSIIGADIVELAPIKGMHHCNYTAAKLIHHIMALSLLHEL